MPVKVGVCGVGGVSCQGGIWCAFQEIEVFETEKCKGARKNINPKSHVPEKEPPPTKLCRRHVDSIQGTRQNKSVTLVNEKKTSNQLISHLLSVMKHDKTFRGISIIL